MDKTSQIRFLKPGEMADLIGVKSRQLTRWAREGRIPKLVLPSGKFVFNPETVIKELQFQGKTDSRCPAGVAV